MARKKMTSMGLGKKAAPPKIVEAKKTKAANSTGKRKGSAKADKPKHWQIRLTMASWLELRSLEIELGRKAQSLGTEAINELLRKYGKAPIAQGPYDKI